MTDRYKVYTKVLKSIKAVVQDQHPGHTVPPQVKMEKWT
jgi:hypothetical protein